MRIPHKLTVLSALITSSLTVGMDQGIVVQRITAVDNPLRAKFLHKKNSLMVAAAQDGVYEVDWQQNKTTRLMIPTQDSNTCTINQQRDAVAAMNYQGRQSTTYLYDVNKEKITWQLTLSNNPSSPTHTFTQSGKLCVVENQGIIHCSNGKSYDLPRTEPGLITHVVADSTEEKLVFTQYANNEKSALKTVALDTNPISITKDFIKNVPPTKENPVGDTLETKKYSPISKLVACHFYFNNFWFIYDFAKKDFIEKTTKLFKNCCTLAFHPKNESQLALLTKDGFVEIYDFLKNETVKRTNYSLLIPTPDSPIAQSDIDFSEDGEKLAVTLGTERYDKDRNITFDYRLLVLSNLYSKK